MDFFRFSGPLCIWRQKVYTWHAAEMQLLFNVILACYCKKYAQIGKHSKYVPNGSDPILVLIQQGNYYIVANYVPM